MYAPSDFPRPIRSHSCAEGSVHNVQNRPESNLDVLVRFWPNASGPEASQCTRIIGPGFWQDATSLLPVSHFQTRFRFCTDGSNHIMQNQPGSSLVFGCLCQVLAKQIRSGSKPVCNNHPVRLWPTLLSLSGLLGRGRTNGWMHKMDRSSHWSDGLTNKKTKTKPSWRHQRDYNPRLKLQVGERSTSYTLPPPPPPSHPPPLSPFQQPRLRAKASWGRFQSTPRRDPAPSSQREGGVCYAWHSRQK